MRVLLTRRREDSERSAARYRDAGFEPILLPLFERRMTGAALPENGFDFSVFTSAAAVEAVDSHVHEKLRHLPAYAVGQRTGTVLKQYSYINVRYGNGDAIQLGERILADMAAEMKGAACDRRIISGIHPCGKVRSVDFGEIFAGSMRGVSIGIVEWEVYETRQLDPGRKAFGKAITPSQNLVIPLYSPASAEHFFDLVERYDAGAEIAKARFVAISERCAEKVPELHSRQVAIAQHPNEEAMVATAEALMRKEQ